MKSFLSKILILIAISSFTLLFIVAWMEAEITQTSLESSPNDIDLLILGDSHAQNGINPEYLDKPSFNFAASGENYFFCLQKLKFLLDNSKKINCVILTLGSHNVDSKIDSLWVTNNDNFVSKTSSYFGMISQHDFLEFAKYAGFNYTVYTSLFGQIPMESINLLERKMLLRKPPFLGGYTPNEKTLNIQTVSTVLPKQVPNYSNIQIRYLNQIIETCSSHNIPIVLLNIPTYKGENLNEELFYKLKSPYSLLDMGTMFNELPNYFADSNHLNPLGAGVFTQALNDSLVNILSK